MADVSAVADPATGVAVFDSINGGGFTVYGGTSVASPVVAAIFALVGKGGVDNSFPYNNTGAFNDVTSGTNGTCAPKQLCTGGVAWDGPTGIGTPNGTAIQTGQGGSDSGGPDSGGSDSGGSDSGPGDGGGVDSGGGDSGGTCSHSDCSTGAKLTSGCDPCVTKICAQDSFCCNTNWDSICVSEVSSICGQTCGGTGTCSHSECTTGKKLVKSCDACVTKICASDPFCCNTNWDSICVSEVSSICGKTCN